MAGGEPPTANNGGASGGTKRSRGDDESPEGAAKRAAAGTEGAASGATGRASSTEPVDELLTHLDQERLAEAYDPLNPDAHVELAAAATAAAAAAASEAAENPRTPRDKVLQRTPSGWMECYDQAKQRSYWFNKKTGESAWSRPAAATALASSGSSSSAAAAQRAESQFSTGQRLFKQNLYEEAASAFTKALEGGHSDKGKVFSWRGVANDFLERHDAAFSDHDAAVVPGKCAPATASLIRSSVRPANTRACLSIWTILSVY